jgi:glycosyltransferase involved in cell wall biosynthesis
MQRHLVSDIGLPANQTQVISNGVDCQHFSINKISLNVTNRPVKKMMGKNRLGLTVSNLANQPLKILFVGRFEIEKALLILLRALAKVEIPVKLRLVGGGGQLAALKQTVKGLGLDQKVEFVKAMPEKELLEQYCWADVFVMPSPMESQSIVTLQAMACSLPVIGANTGALPELVMPSQTGWLFKSDDLNDLAKKIELAANQDLRQKYGLQARKHALKHNAGAVYQTWLKLYRNLLS